MKVDAIIIGAGQAGTPLAVALADKGWKVVLVEKANLGGTCINTGCTPTKTMVHRAQVAHYARNAARWGVKARDVTVDLPKIIAQKEAVVRSFRSGQEKRVDQQPNLRLMRGKAQFVTPHEVAVEGETLESEHIFINCGARANVPEIPGMNTLPYLTNETIMELNELPKHLTVLGGGYIGLEFGQMFARFGSRVTVVQSNSQIVPREDAEVAEQLQKALEEEGIKFLLNAETKRAEHQNQSIALHVETDGQSSAVVGSHLLVATGRRPNTDGLGLERAGIEMNRDGTIKVNNKLETNVAGVWALGDVKGGPAFTHISYNDYQVVFGNVVEGKNLTIDKRIVPYCVFTDPQLGGVGLTEKEARAKGYRLKVGQIPMSSVARAIERDETAGMMKVVIDASDDRILGASILSSDGGETVHILYALMLAGAPYTVLKGAVYIHPTLAEGLFSLLENVKPVSTQEENRERKTA